MRAQGACIGPDYSALTHMLARAQLDRRSGPRETVGMATTAGKQAEEGI